MQVTDYTIGMAVLRIFRDFRVFHDGGTLLLQDIEQVWHDTGLRTRDLETGLKWLERNSCARLDLDRAYAAAVVRLLPAGAQHIGEFPTRLSEWMAEMDAALTLMWTQRRAHRGELLKRVRCSLHGFRPESVAAA